MKKPSGTATIILLFRRLTGTTKEGTGSQSQGQGGKGQGHGQHPARVRVARAKAARAMVGQPSPGKGRGGQEGAASSAAEEMDLQGWAHLFFFHPSTTGMLGSMQELHARGILMS